MKYELLNLDFIKENISSDEEFAATVLSMLKETSPKDLADVQQAVDVENHESIRQSAHKIKSSYRSLGIDQVAGLFQEIENIGKEKSAVSEAKVILAKASEAVDSTNAEIKIFLEQG